MPLDAEKKGKLRSKFAALNKDGDKFLDFHEMSKLLRKGNPGMSDAELRSVYNGVDKNGDGKVSFDEFVEYLYPGEGLKTGGGRGPERFFYDKSSYTGVHTKGGPSTIDRVDNLTTFRNGS
mmetsp:Transcript_90608/g.180223  ORF Transcript_90608/g.180223 Transcript_90608/m.180223 type:complete len:121 (+) Transcript_90608:89-451(+)